MKVRISQPYRYAHTLRVRFTCGIFCATRTFRKGDDVLVGAREFAEGIRRYRRNI
jgi:hypothetical protein